jgi:F-type H+-transporting ATPase subunit b
MKIKKIIIFILNFLLFPILVIASEHAAGGGHETSQLIGKIINSGILWGGLTYLLYKPISLFFKEKAEKEKIDFMNSENEKKAKEDELRSVEKRIEGIEAELKKIKERFKEEAEKDSIAFGNKTEEDLNKLKKFTEQEIEHIYSEALKELKLFALDISVSLAKDRLRKKINKKTQKQLVENFINQLGEMN